MSVAPPPGEPTPADRASQTAPIPLTSAVPPTAAVPQAAPVPPTAPVPQTGPVQQTAPLPQPAGVPQTAPVAVAGPTAARRIPRRGTLVAALVVAIALLVGSVGATVAWAHDARLSSATQRPGIERLFGGQQPGRVWVRPGMPGKMFGGVPGGRAGLPGHPARPKVTPTPTPSPTTGY